LALLPGVSEHRRLTLCVYLKHFQLHARFRRTQDVVPRQVLEFLASQVDSAIESWTGGVDIPDRPARFYKSQIGAFLDIQRFDEAVQAHFVEWLVQSTLLQTPNEATLNAAITEWFLLHRMIHPRGKDLAHLVACAECQFEHLLFARITSRLSDIHRAGLDGLIKTTDGNSQFAEVACDSALSFLMGF